MTAGSLSMMSSGKTVEKDVAKGKLLFFHLGSGAADA
jgi:hypothetical protein